MFHLEPNKLYCKFIKIVTTSINHKKILLNIRIF